MPLVLVPCHVLLFDNPSLDIANFGGNFIQSLSKGFLNSQHFFTSIWLPLNEACAPLLQIHNLLKTSHPWTGVSIWWFLDFRMTWRLVSFATPLPDSQIQRNQPKREFLPPGHWNGKIEGWPMFRSGRRLLQTKWRWRICLSKVWPLMFEECSR